jgi:hypothetical protein
MFNMKTYQKTRIFLSLLLLLIVSPGFAVKLAVLPELNRPSYIEIRDDEAYVLDDTVVKVYSLKDCRLLRQFGKTGNGPGELMPNDEIPLQMQLVNGQVFLNSQTKFIHYSYAGEVLKEKATHFMCMQILLLGKNYCISRVNFTQKMEIFFHIILYDPDLNPLKTIYTSKPTSTIRSHGKAIIPANFTYLKLAPSGKRLYVFSGRQEDFQVLVFDLHGKPLKPIKMDYQCPKWTDAFKQEFIDWFKTFPRFSAMGGNEDLIKQYIEFPVYLPAIRDILPGEKRLYVQTYKKKKNDSEFFVFDENARLVKQVFLPDESRYLVKMNPDVTFTIKNDRYYYLVENTESGDWELHMASIKL